MHSPTLIPFSEDLELAAATLENPEVAARAASDHDAAVALFLRNLAAVLRAEGSTPLVDLLHARLARAATDRKLAAPVTGRPGDPTEAEAAAWASGALRGARLRRAGIA